MSPEGFEPSTHSLKVRQPADLPLSIYKINFFKRNSQVSPEGFETSTHNLKVRQLADLPLKLQTKIDTW